MLRLQRRTRRRIVYGLLLTAIAKVTWSIASRPTPGNEPVVVLATAQAAPSKLPAAPARDTVVPKSQEPVPKVRKYTVVPGDTAEAIARRFDLRTDTILWSNQLEDDSLLQIGQELLIPATDGMIHTVAEGDTLWEIAAIHGSDVDKVILANGDTSSETLQPGQMLLIPGGSPRRRAPVQIASRSGSPGRPAVTTWLWPLSGEITERFGWRTHPVYGTRNYHEGIDLDAAVGTTVVASGSGTIALAGWYGGYGLTVRIDHGDGVASRYSHNSVLLVKEGDRVSAGQPIARSGNTGVSTGPHLDLGFYQNGVPVDPLAFLP